MKKKIISTLLALAMVSGLAVVPSYAMTADDFTDTYAEKVIDNNYDTETANTDAPDGSAGYKKITAETDIWSSDDADTVNDFFMALDFRFDEGSTDPSMTLGNGKDIGPMLKYYEGQLVTKTGSGATNNQKLGAMEINKWYHIEMQGRVKSMGARVDFKLYKWENGEKTLVQSTENINLRNYSAGSTKSDPKKFLVSAGVSVDNAFFAKIYPDTVTVAPTVGTSTEIIAGGSLALSASATVDGKQSSHQEVEWSVYNTDGTAPETDTNISVNEQGVVSVNKHLAATKNVKIRATSKTKGSPYGEYAITAVYNEAAANDKYDSLEISTEKNRNYVRANDPLTINAVGKDASGNPVAADEVASDIVWTVLNKSATGTVSNTNISLENGVLSVNENVVAQDIVVKASNKSGSIETFLNVAVRPYNMNAAGETSYTDTYVSSDAFEEPTQDTAITFHESGSVDGSAYYEVNADGKYDCVGFAAKTNKDVMFSADIKFPSDGSGMQIMDGSGHLGMILGRESGSIGTRSGSGKSDFKSFFEADSDAWYNVTIIASAGHMSDEGVTSYATAVIYKYADGEKVNPADPASSEPLIKGLALRNLDKDQAKNINLFAGTYVDNVVNAYVAPNNFTIQVEPNIVLAGNTAKATATAKWNMVDMPNISSDTVEFGIYDANDQYPLAGDDVTIDAEGNIKVSSLAAAQDVYVGVKAKNADNHTSVKLEIKSSDIFEVKSIGFNEDYSKLVAIDVNKLYSYDKDVTFVIAAYDKNKALKWTRVRTAYGSDIPDGESSVKLDADMTGFNKDEDTLKVFTWTKLV